MKCAKTYAQSNETQWNAEQNDKQNKVLKNVFHLLKENNTYVTHVKK